MNYYEINGRRWDETELRSYAKRKEVKLWEIAKELGVGESTLRRWLRSSLTPERTTAIIKAVDKMYKEKNQRKYEEALKALSAE